jgi:D-beta-D-heptose 7-phosphate kinase/D-beta-D-heptose 1-phosphate adenosyltransferase
MNEMNILVIGDSIVDHYLSGRINRQSPEDPSIPVVDIEHEEFRLGGCLNVAANLKTISPHWAGKPLYNIHLSSFISSFIRKKVDAKNIDSGLCFCFPGRSEGPSKYELVKTRIINCLKEVGLDFFDAIVISDYDKGLVDKEIVERIKGYKKTVFIDTKKSDLSFWKDIPNKIIKINQDEFNRCTNKESVSCLIVTQGSKGCSWYSNGKLRGNQPTKAVKNPDVVGAGDVFLAGLVVQYLDTDGDLLESMRFANAAARVSVTKYATCEVTYNEVKNEGSLCKKKK